MRQTMMSDGQKSLENSMKQRVNLNTSSNRGPLKNTSSDLKNKEARGNLLMKLDSIKNATNNANDPPSNRSHLNTAGVDSVNSATFSSNAAGSKSPSIPKLGFKSDMTSQPQSAAKTGAVSRLGTMVRRQTTIGAPSAS